MGAPAIPPGIPSELLERRPDIAAAERATAQANAQIGVAKAAFYPNVTLSAVAGFQSLGIASWFAWPSRVWSLGPSLAETVFDGGLRKTTVRQYQAAWEQTVATYRQTVLTAFQQVEDNLAALRVLTQVIGQQDAAIRSADRSLQEARVRYTSGIDPYLNVITAQTILLNDRQTAVSFRMQQMVASVQLIKALGGGWSAAALPSPKDLQSNAYPGAKP
jgi:NodT family efflux transporter outer membrane factor (OMF) lipoprotein